MLLFDEPSSGIAQRETEALGPLLLRIRDATGASLLVIEHDMPLVTSISDEMLALDLGRVIARGKPQDVVNDPAVVESYLGGSEERDRALRVDPSPEGREARHRSANRRLDGRRRRDDDGYDGYGGMGMEEGTR